MSTYGDVMIRIRADAGPFVREMAKARAAVRGISDDIDTSNDRTAWMVQGFLALAPALAPLGAAVVPVIAGLSAGMVVGAAAAGTMALAFNGVGDALSALNKAQLEPTAENIQALHEAMQKIGPDGAEFVRTLDDAAETFSVLGMDARAGMFPGMTEGIESILTLMPQFRQIVTEISQTIGDLSSDAGAGLAGPEFQEFFEYLRTDAGPILSDMGRTLGNFIDGFASMIVAFSPATDDFSNGLLDMSRSFERWAEGLDSSESFEEFLDYVAQSGPKALDLFGALVGALVELTKAAAPVGDAVLPVLTALFNGIALVADTPIGQFAILGAAITSLIGRFAALQKIAGGPIMRPFVTGITNQAKAVRTASGSIRGDLGAMASVWATSGARTTREQERMDRASRNLGRNFGLMTRNAIGAAAPLAAIAVASGAAGEGLQQSNTALFTMIGLSGGPWGAAAGAIIGGFLDMKAAVDRANDAISGDMTDALDEFEARKDRIDPTDPMNWITGEGVRAGVEDLYSLATTGETATHALARASGEWGRFGTLTLQNGETLLEARDRLRGMTQAQREQERASLRQKAAMQEARTATREAASAFLDYSDAIVEGKFSLRDYLDQLEKQVRAQRNFDRNIQNLRGRGVGESILQTLIKEGPAAARAVAALAGATDAQLRRFVRSMNAGAAGVRHFGEDTRHELEKATDAFRSLPKNVRTNIKTNGIPQTEADIDKLVAKYHLTEKQRTALVTLKDLASPRIQDVLAKLLNLDRQSPTPHAHLDYGALAADVNNAERLIAGLDGDTANTYIITHHQNVGQPRAPHAYGGLVRGPGGPTDDRVPIMASNREYVVKAAAVEKYGVAAMESINNMAVPAGPEGMAAAVSANRFAGGGSVGRWSAAGGTQVVLHEVRVTGELDARRGMAHIEQLADGISRRNAAAEYDQRDQFNRREWGN